MLLSLNLALAIIPAIALLVYFYRQDRLRPEPRGLIVMAFLLGFLAVILTILLSIPFVIGGWMERLDFWLSIAIKSFIAAGLLEESAKLLVFWKFLYHREEFDEVTDGIVYMVTISLGFACLENLFYSYNSTAVALLRAFTAVPGHAIWSGLMGYYVGLSKFRPAARRQLIGRGLALAVLVHGSYDFFAFSETGLVLLIFPILIVGFLVIRKAVARTRQTDLDEGLIGRGAGDSGRT